MNNNFGEAKLDFVNRRETPSNDSVDRRETPTN